MNEKTDSVDKLAFWDNVLRAAGTEPKKPRPIRGASGQYHEVLAVGTDEPRDRLLIVSGEHDARSAVLAQYDIQSAVKKLRVVTIRPALISVPKAAQALQAVLGAPELTQEAMQKLGQDEDIRNAILNPSVGSLNTVASSIKIDVLPQILQLIQQLAEIRIDSSDVKDQTSSGTFTLDFTRLVDRDPIEKDREYGICAVPFYDISGDEIETIISGKSIDDVVQILRTRDIFQFFFPAADDLALGLVERGMDKKETVENEIATTESLGHPLGELEVVSAETDPSDLVAALQDKGLVVEGEYGLEILEEGQKIRMSVKFKPKEGIVSKLINRFSVNLDLKDLFGK